MKKILFIPMVAMFAHTFGDPGDFDESTHLNFLAKAEEMWENGEYTKDLIPHVDMLVKQINMQSARFEELNDPNKDNFVHVTWLVSCGMETEDFVREDDTCEISGAELQSKGKDYQYDRLQSFSFSVNEEKIRTGTYSFEEQVASGLMRGDKQLSEWYAKGYAAFLKANAGPNPAVIMGMAAPFTWDAVANTTRISDANYNESIIASLIKQEELNDAVGGWYVDSGKLFEPWKNAGLDSGNLDGKGDDLRTKQLDIIFDMWTIRRAGLTESMFFVDSNAVAFKTYTRYSDKPKEYGGKVQQTRYRMKSNVLPGVYWDVIYTLTCTSGAIVHTWRLITEGGMWTNPYPCPQDIDGTEYTTTGIISYTAGA